jgi:hypothetical protein
MSTWPDPENPGVPMNPERDGRHWLFDAKSNVSFPEFWVAGMGAWAVGDAWTARMVAEMGLHYQGPVLMPAEADALRAENARLRDALREIAEKAAAPGYAPEQCRSIWWMARAALDPVEQQERRAKALAELAEMDADLLDIDPEVKP